MTIRRLAAGALDYTAPVSLGLALWAWALHLPYAERILTARLSASVSCAPSPVQLAEAERFAVPAFR